MYTNAAHTQHAITLMQGRTSFDLVSVLRATYVRGEDPQSSGREDPSAFQWSELRAESSKMFRTAPGVNCMLGPLDAEPKVRYVSR
jgi:hypothetical protein